MADVGGCVSIVTGGGGGVGRAVASRLATLGAVVVVNDLGTDAAGNPSHEVPADRTVADIQAAGGQAVGDSSSVADPEQCDALVSKVLSQYGRLDVLINTAGNIRRSVLTDCTAEDWESVLGVHLGGHLNMIRPAVNTMVSGRGGRIVNVSSGSGLLHMPPASIAYATAKRAIAALTWHVRRELPVGIALNAVAPVATTRMTSPAAQRSAAEAGAEMAKPAAIARVFSALSSRACDDVNGSVLFCNGRELSKIEPPRCLEFFSANVAQEVIWRVCEQVGHQNRSVAGGLTPRFPRPTPERLRTVGGPRHHRLGRPAFQTACRGVQTPWHRFEYVPNWRRTVV